MSSKVSFSDAFPLGHDSAHPHPEPSTGISILIVGAGVGGIMTALECWRKGHTVRILERSQGPVETG
jgi:cation diffusion facilitator CzcD-associated flavoprotein CzcO